jgi:hypothetical protein
MRVFNVGCGGTLTYRRSGSNITDEYSIDCRLESVPEVTFNDSRNIVEFTINLKCFNPYWRGKPVVEDISMIRKLGHFPLVIPAGKKFVFGYRAQTLKTTFDNIGDAVAGAVYTLKAEGGTVTNPSIKHENSVQTLKTFHTLQNGENIIITSQPDFRGIVINKLDGTKLNGMQMLTDATKRRFFMIDFGENTISFNADANVTNFSVSAAYTPLYLEVP